MIKGTVKIDYTQRYVLTSEQIFVAKMMRSYENRANIIFTCLKIAIEHEFVKDHGYDLVKKNSNNDFSWEEKYIACSINGRKYSFHSTLTANGGGWRIGFDHVNLEVIQKEF